MPTTYAPELNETGHGSAKGSGRAVRTDGFWKALASTSPPPSLPSDPRRRINRGQVLKTTLRTVGIFLRVLPLDRENRGDAPCLGPDIPARGPASPPAILPPLLLARAAPVPRPLPLTLATIADGVPEVDLQLHAGAQAELLYQVRGHNRVR